MSFRVQLQVALTGSNRLYIGRLCERNMKRAGNKRRELNKFDLLSRWALVRVNLGKLTASGVTMGNSNLDLGTGDWHPIPAGAINDGAAGSAPFVR